MFRSWKKEKKKDVEAVARFREDEDLLITFAQLSEIPINEVQQLYPENNGAVEFLRIENNSDNLSFRVTMKEGSFWKHHYHDSFETIVIFKGKLSDTISGQKAGRGEIMAFREYTTHYVIAEEESIFYVEFTKPKINGKMDTK